MNLLFIAVIPNVNQALEQLQYFSLSILKINVNEKIGSCKQSTYRRKDSENHFVQFFVD